ncbi:MAG: SusC/RagA family TonB-linked outer membrane protein [Chitinophagaceae bacterium]
MRQLHLVLVFMLLLIAGIPAAFAQKRTVSGKISESNGKPVPFVNVIVKGTNVGTNSNAEGVFSIDVPDGSNTLVVSIIGYQTQEVKIAGRTNLDITMTTDVNELATVTVTALGIERKTKSLQYSVTTVGGENLTQARENSVINSLEGRVAGVNVSKIATGPGSSTRVVIRGAKTLGSNLNQPLYVVDGVPIDNTNQGQAGLWGGTDNGDGMSSINPDDVANITVLKGASAAALYGSRAANGVILITTKKGSNRKGIGVEVNSNYVAETVNNLTDFQTGYGEGGMVGTTLQNRVATKPTSIAQSFGNGWSSQAWGPKFDGSPVVQFDGVSRPYSYVGDNWARFYRTGGTWTNSASLTGGTDGQNFRFSIADLKNTAVVPNSGFDRINVSLATNSKVAKKLSFNSKILYSNEKVKNRPFVSDSPGNYVQSIYRLPGDVNVLDLIGDPNKPGAVPSLQMQADKGITIFDGKPVGEEFQRNTDLWTQNPYWAAYQFINTDVRDRVIASGQLKYDITDFLYVQGQAGMDWYTLRRTNLTPQGTGFSRGGSMSEGETRVREINYEWTMGFNKTFNKIGVNAFVGGNRMRRTSENVSANGNGFNTPLFPAINNANQRNFGYGYGQQGINSLFGSAEVSYNNYLFVVATARKDWFSTLNPKDNGILYPSVGASFVFSDAFTMPAWLSYGKLRTSWAQVGNANSVGAYSTVLAYSAGSTHNGIPLGSYSSGYSKTSNLPNPNLKPFTSTEMEYGLELKFLKGRLGLDFTYYDQETTDDILDAGISRASGFNSTSVNIGKITNKGIEVLLTGTPVKGNLTWDVSLNLSKNNSNVVSLIEGQKEFVGEEPRTRNVFIKNIVGYPYGMITGKAQMKDAAGNLVYDETTGAAVAAPGYQILGNGVADFTGGVNNSFIWKGINLTFLIDFKSGGDIFSGTNMRMTQQGQTKQTLLGRAGEAPLVLTGVSPDGSGGFKPFTKTYTPGEAQNYWNQLGSEGNGAADKFIYDASFIKLRQVTLGYSIPKKIFQKTPVQTLMVSFVARNLAILKKNTPNIDPESTYSSSNSQGLDYFGYPSTRTYGFNIRATF